MYLPMQGIPVQSPVPEDLTGSGETNPRARVPQQEMRLQGEACAPQPEKAHVQQQRPSAAKNN